MARKFAIELDDRVFEELKAAYMEAKKMSPAAESFTFEEFLSELLRSYADTKKQMDMMGDQFKNMMNNFNANGGLEELFSNFMKQSPLTQEPNPKETNKKDTKSETKEEASEEKTYKS